MDQVDSPEIVDDFEIGQDEVVDIKDNDVNKQKLRRRVDQYKACLSNLHQCLFKCFYHYHLCLSFSFEWAHLGFVLLTRVKFS